MAREVLDNQAQEHVAGVAVLVPLPGRERESLHRLQGRKDFTIRDTGVINIQLGLVWYTGGVCQQMPDRHHTDRIRESGHEIQYRIVVRQAVLLCEHHDRSRGDGLGKRCQARARFGRVRPAGAAIGHAERAFVDDVSFRGHEDLAGEQVPVVELADEALDLRAAVAESWPLGERSPPRAQRRSPRRSRGGSDDGRSYGLLSFVPGLICCAVIGAERRGAGTDDA